MDYLCISNGLGEINLSRRTKVSAHPRKGTKGVKQHNRDVSSRESRRVGHATSVGHYQVAGYSKAKTKKDLIRIVNDNPTNPPVDMNEHGRGPYGTPEEIRKYMGFDRLVIYGPRRSYTAKLSYDDGKWSVK